MKHPSTKLAGYAAVAACSVALNKPAEAQIVYHNIDPDNILGFYGADEYSYDFDTNGTIDFTISNDLWFNIGCPYSGSYGPICYGTTYQSLDVFAAGILNNLAAPYPYGADTLHFNDAISGAGTWTTGGWARLYEAEGDWNSWGADVWIDASYSGNWHSVTDKYLGIRFLKDGELHYGWVQLSTSISDYAGEAFYIKAYAYEATAGIPVHAGDVGGCFTPVPVGTTNISSTGAKAKWNSVGSADFYEMQYRAVGAAMWTSKIIDAPKTFKKINGLNCATSYEWKVRTTCADGFETDFSPVQNFTTTVCRLEGPALPETESIEITTDGNSLFISIEDEITQALPCRIFDITGSEVTSLSLTSDYTEVQPQLPSGIYVVVIPTSDQVYSQKVILFH